MKSLLYESIGDMPLLPKKATILSGFRPSASPGQTDKGSSLTLGHMTQVQQIHKIKKYLDDKNIPHDIYCVVADSQGLLDKYTEKNHRESISKYTKKYCAELSASLPDSDIHLYRKSDINKEVERLGLKMANYISFPEFLKNIEEKEKKIQSNLGTPASLAKILGSTIFQSASMLGVRANIVPAGRDQMGTVEIYNTILSNLGNTTEFPESCVGISNEQMLIGLDGNIMSTSRGNHISLDDDSNSIFEKVKKADDGCLDSIITNFGKEQYIEVHKLSREKKVELCFTLIEAILLPIKLHLKGQGDSDLHDRLDQGAEKYKQSILATDGLL